MDQLKKSPCQAKSEATTFARPPHFWSTLLFLYLVCLIEGADQQLLPASFRALERSLGVSPSDLARLGFAQAFAQCVFGIVWAGLADAGWSRRMLLVAGTFSWAFLTLLLAMVESFASMVLLRALNGVALGCLNPIAQSLIADMTQPNERGLFFGAIQMFMMAGFLFSSIFATTVSNMTILGFEGWRFAFATVAALSFILCFFMALFMRELPRINFTPEPLSADRVVQKLGKYWRIPTFRLLVLQGAFGCIPWSAMSFMTMFFQYVGIPDLQAAAVAASSIAGAMIGGILGGFISDALTRWNRFHGRPLTAQISVGSGLPLMTAVLLLVPRDPSSLGTYFSLMFVFGLVASWCAVGVNRPILTEVIGASDRASIVAWLVALDGAFAACFGAPIASSRTASSATRPASYRSRPCRRSKGCRTPTRWQRLCSS